MSEALALTWDDVSHTNDSMSIRITSSKTEQAGEAEICMVPTKRSSSLMCPVHNLMRWQSRCTSTFIFPKFSDISLPMTYDNASRELKRVVSSLSLNPLISCHSFRGGGATTAISRGVPLSGAMRQGRWKAYQSLNSYVDVTHETTLGASDLLGDVRLK